MSEPDELIRAQLLHSPSHRTARRGGEKTTISFITNVERLLSGSICLVKIACHTSVSHDTQRGKESGAKGRTQLQTMNRLSVFILLWCKVTGHRGWKSVDSVAFGWEDYALTDAGQKHLCYTSWYSQSGVFFPILTLRFLSYSVICNSWSLFEGLPLSSLSTREHLIPVLWKQCRCTTCFGEAEYCENRIYSCKPRIRGTICNLDNWPPFSLFFWGCNLGNNALWFSVLPSHIP